MSDKAPTMFGYSLFLIKDDITNKTSLVFVDKGAKLLPNSDFLFISEKNSGSRICKVNETAGDMITFSLHDDDGTEYSSSVSVNSNEYGGIVKWQNRFLGKLFEPFSQRSNMPFIYMLIGGICALILLLLVLLYFFFQKKDIPNEDNEESDYSLSENTTVSPEADALNLDIPPNQIPPPMMAEDIIINDILPPLLPPPLSALPVQSFGRDEMPSYIETPHPPKETYYDEEIPSIESLIAEIDLLGYDLEENEK